MNTASAKRVRAIAGSVTTVIIGAGQAGLAMSDQLSRRSIDHVLLERGDIANSWRTERWDSLCMLTPKWQSRLGDYRYNGNDADGYMGMSELIQYLDGYARCISAPVYTGTRVSSVQQTEGGYRVLTDRGEWRCRSVVIASGAYNRPVVPAVAEGLPTSLETHTAFTYRNPQQLPEGEVLVVGASATGLQIAAEIGNSGRPVTLAVGEHVRMPRRYRGRDIMWWMDRLGIMDQGYEEMDDLNRVRRLPSAQLSGATGGRDLDLNSLAAKGVTLVGKLAGAHNGRAQFSGSLNNVCRLADLKMQRLLSSIDAGIAERGLPAEDACEYAPTAVNPDSPLELDMQNGRFRSVIWATGFRPDYSWLQVPVLDRKGKLVHDGGVVDAPGLYAMGLPFMRTRKSGFLDGVSDDAAYLAAHLAGFVRQGRTQFRAQQRAVLSEIYPICRSAVV